MGFKGPHPHTAGDSCTVDHHYEVFCLLTHPVNTLCPLKKTTVCVCGGGGGALPVPGSPTFLGQTLTFWDVSDQGKDSPWSTMSGCGPENTPARLPCSSPTQRREGAGSDL